MTKWVGIWAHELFTDGEIKKMASIFGVAYLYQFKDLFYLVNQRLIPNQGGLLVRVEHGARYN